jgi:hypothetical protein
MVPFPLRNVGWGYAEAGPPLSTNRELVFTDLNFLARYFGVHPASIPRSMGDAPGNVAANLFPAPQPHHWDPTPPLGGEDTFDYGGPASPSVTPPPQSTAVATPEPRVASPPGPLVVTLPCAPSPFNLGIDTGSVPVNRIVWEFLDGLVQRKVTPPAGNLPPSPVQPPVPRLPGMVNGPAVLDLPLDVLSEFGQSPPMSPSPVATQPPVHPASPAPPPPTEEEEEAVAELRGLYEALVAQTTYVNPIWISSSLI